MLTKQKAFDIIKAKLVMVSVVTYPNFNKLFILYTDVLDGGIGAILHQKDDRRKQIIICIS